MKVAEFEIDGRAAAVHVTEEGTVRLELPAGYLVKSIYPGSTRDEPGDEMNVNLVKIEA
jgi:hypothetical protein